MERQFIPNLMVNFQNILQTKLPNFGIFLFSLRASLLCFKTDEITVSHLVTFEHFFNESPFVDVWVKT